MTRIEQLRDWVQEGEHTDLALADVVAGICDEVALNRAALQMVIDEMGDQASVELKATRERLKH